MNLYRIRYEGENDFVEAETFIEAIKLWQAVVRNELGDDDDPDPEEVQLVNDDPVIRAPLPVPETAP